MRSWPNVTDFENKEEDHEPRKVGNLLETGKGKEVNCHLYLPERNITPLTP
jgi:hypothetical protein